MQYCTYCTGTVVTQYTSRIIHTRARSFRAAKSYKVLAIRHVSIMYPRDTAKQPIKQILPYCLWSNSSNLAWKMLGFCGPQSDNVFLGCEETRLSVELSVRGGDSQVVKLSWLGRRRWISCMLFASRRIRRPTRERRNNSNYSVLRDLTVQ